MIEWRSENNSIIFNIEDNELIFNGGKYPLECITNQKLINMYLKQNINLPGDFYTDEKILYRCVRKLVKGINSKQEAFYMDILLYESALGIISKESFSRSLGHLNDVNEIEIHQVLRGKVLELIIYEGKSYIGVFGESEYFEIPANAFHCTYVLENNTMIANIFGNVYWENDYTMKPYGECKNLFRFEKRDNHFAVKIENGGSCEFEEDLMGIDRIGVLKYSDLPKEDLRISNQFSLDMDIFLLFDKMSRS